MQTLGLSVAAERPYRQLLRTPARRLAKFRHVRTSTSTAAMNPLLMGLTHNGHMNKKEWQ
ncbi:hypothetical protein LRH25_08045 [Ideonella azotifigens]|nr:hypothetical protein [Ideonella azotifigens]MCD2340292.1 hypothetical protein [Ideonella azotifigens]